MNYLVKRLVFSILLLIACGNLIASDICISDIYITGNKKTRGYVIRRELPFKTGDVLPEDELIKQLVVATEHLNNTSLFNYVNVDYIPDTLNRADCISCVVTVQVEERWYYWPQVSLKLEDRNLSSWLHEKDWSRITIGWGLNVNNVMGMRHKISGFDYFGYEKGGRLSYSNIALDKNRTQMLGISVSALFNKTMNVYTENDKVIYVKNEKEFLDKYASIFVSYSYRPKLRTTHEFRLGYGWESLHDSVFFYNPEYYGSKHLENNTFQLSYKYSYEHRDYVAYPTTGYYIGTELTGIAADRMNFLYSELGLKLQYYKEVFPRWFWSSRLNTRTSFKNRHAYIYDQCVGYDENFITGYDYYAIDGQHHAILNNDIRFLIMPKKVLNMGFIRGLSQFRKIHFTIYAKLTFDGGYVYNEYRPASSTLANTFLYGSGIGIDLVTYYDIVLSCNYAINKMGEKGFYFGIKAAIF